MTELDYLPIGRDENDAHPVHWTDEERAIIRACHRKDMDDCAIARELALRGYQRGKKAVNSARRRMKLFRTVTGRPVGVKNSPRGLSEDHDMRSYWAAQKDADAAFQAALRAAGVPEGVDTNPCTDKPMYVPTPVEVKSAGNFVYPPEVPK